MFYNINYRQCFWLIVLAYGEDLLFNAEPERDFGPEPGILNWFDLFLWIPVDVHVEHETAEWGAKLVWQRVILHTSGNQEQEL